MSISLVQFAPTQSRLPGCILRQSAAPVHFSTINAEMLQELTKELFLLLYSYKEGVGLAASMAGFPLSIAVIDLDNRSPTVLINPQLLEASEAEEDGPEGNLCFPRYFCLVKRPKHIKIRALDQYGEPFELESSGFMARVILHEVDVLNGIMFFDHVTDPSTLENRGPIVLTQRSMELLELDKPPRTLEEQFRSSRWGIVTVPRKLLRLQDTILRQSCEPIDPSELSRDVLKEIVREMFGVLYHHRVTGLSAPQVGLRLPIIVIDQGRGNLVEPVVLINPTIAMYSKETEMGTESSLSIPHYMSHRVERSKSIVVSAWNQHGEPIEMEASGRLARVIQRKVDYLHGRLYTDRVKNLDELAAVDPSTLCTQAMERLSEVQEQKRGRNKLD